MKFLKPKFILLYLIVLLLGIFVMAFAFGGLKASTSSLTIRPWSYEGFTATSDIEKERNLNVQRVVAKNDSFFMTYNEATTVTTIYEVVPGVCDAPEIDSEGNQVNDFSNCTKYYATAQDNTTNPQGNEDTTLSSVFSINYVDKTGGTVSTEIYSTANSAYAYDNNLLKSERLTEYKLVDDGVQVLYNVRKSSSTTNAIPKVIDETSWNNLIIGSVFFRSSYGTYSAQTERGVQGAMVNFDCAQEMMDLGMADLAGYYPLGIKAQYQADPDAASGLIFMGTDEPDIYAHQFFMTNINQEFYDSILNSETSSCNTYKYTVNYATIYTQESKDYMIANNLAEEANFTPTSNGWRISVFSDEFAIGKHINVYGSPCITNPYINAAAMTSNYLKMSDAMIGEYPPGYMLDGAPKTLDADMSTVSGSKYASVYNILCNRTEVGQDAYGNSYTNQFGNIAYSGGIHQIVNVTYENEEGDDVTVRSFVYQTEDDTLVAQDGYGNWKVVTVDDESIYSITDEDYTVSGDLIAVQGVFTTELTNELNAVYDIVFESGSGTYQICIEYVLTEDGLKATILRNSIVENDERGQLINLNMLPFFTYCIDSKNSEGMMVIPDGSGAVVNFTSDANPVKSGSSNYLKTYYGSDTTVPYTSKPESTENLMLGMYGYIDNTKKEGIVGIVEEGGALTSLYVSPYRTNGTLKDVNNIYFRIKFREGEVITSGGVQFSKYTSALAENDFTFRYIIMDSNKVDGTFNYDDVANTYRKYLVDRYSLVEKDTTTTNATYLNVLGGYEKYKLFAGVKYKSTSSLTNYEEVEQILRELNGEDDSFSNMNVIYRSWTTDAMENAFTSTLKASRKLGSTNELEILQSYLESKGYNLYPELYTLTAKEYDYFMGKVKYTAKTVGKTYSEQYQFNLATDQEDRTLNTTINISPKYLTAYINDFIDSFTSHNFQSAFISDIGNRRLGDYARSFDEIYDEEGKYYQIDAMKQLNDNLSGGLVLSAPYDYAFPYITGAINVPMSATSLQLFDYSIPLYQLVVSGLFDYAGVSVNNSISKDTNWFLLKSIETGSNLQFIVSYTDPKELLDTDYTNYYDTYFVNNKNNIISMNNELNQTGIMQGKLVYHEMLVKDVSLVTYEMTNNNVNTQVNFIINLSLNNYVYNGVTIRPNTYQKIS